MELSFLTLKKQDIAGQQIGALDNEMLRSFVAVGIYTCQVRAVAETDHPHCSAFWCQCRCCMLLHHTAYRGQEMRHYEL